MERPHDTLVRAAAVTRGGGRSWQSVSARGEVLLRLVVKHFTSLDASQSLLQSEGAALRPVHPPALDLGHLQITPVERPGSYE